MEKNLSNDIQASSSGAGSIMDVFARLVKSVAAQIPAFAPKAILGRLAHGRAVAEVAHQLVYGTFNSAPASFYDSLRRNYGDKALRDAMGLSCWSHIIKSDRPDENDRCCLVTPTMVALAVTPSEWFDILWDMAPKDHANDRVLAGRMAYHAELKELKQAEVTVDAFNPLLLFCASRQPDLGRDEWSRRLGHLFERAGAPSPDLSHACEMLLMSKPQKLAEFKAFVERSILARDVSNAGAARRKARSL